MQGVASTASGVVWYINWEEQSKVRLVSGHTGQVTGAATTRDGLQLATCCKGGTVAVWGLDSLDQTVVFQTPKKVSSPPPIHIHLLPPSPDSVFMPPSS